MAIIVYIECLRIAHIKLFLVFLFYTKSGQHSFQDVIVNRIAWATQLCTLYIDSYLRCMRLSEHVEDCLPKIKDVLNDIAVRVVSMEHDN